MFTADWVCIKCLVMYYRYDSIIALYFSIEQTGVINQKIYFCCDRF